MLQGLIVFVVQSFFVRWFAFLTFFGNVEHFWPYSTIFGVEVMLKKNILCVFYAYRLSFEFVVGG